MLKISTSTPFARPADTTAYTSGDLVANNATAGSVVPISLGVTPVPGGTGVIKRVKLFKSGAVVTNAAFRVHFFTATPTPPTNGDNGAWVSPHAGYLGSVDVTIDKAFTNGAAGTAALGDNAIAFDLAAGQTRLFAQLEARGAYTPASAEQFTLTAEIDYQTE